MKRLKFLKKLQGWRRYQTDLSAFKRAGGTIMRLKPMLDDFEASAGTTGGHYFHQDLLVANAIFASRPVRHIDVGSRIDGFVAHVASFREIEVADIRPFPNSVHPNITFLQMDFMRNDVTLPAADSVSCLHALEHFGLGRYGDAIEVDGHMKGFSNLVRMVKPGGRLYVSFPIGSRTEVHFNAHRIFHPQAIFSWPGASMLELTRFDFVDDAGDCHRNCDVGSLPETMNYCCGIYTFSRLR